MEKMIGIVVVLVIGALFTVMMYLGSLYLIKWRQKGINPSNAFPRNPKGGELSNDQQRALNVGAILAGSNSDFFNSLQTSKSVAKRTIEDILARDWEIHSAQDALERLEDLKYNGHRQMCSFILKNASQLLASEENTSVNPRNIYEQTGFSLLDKRILTEYANEVALVEKHIDLIDELLNASSFEDVKKYEALFGDEKTFSICIQIFHRFYEQCIVYASRTVNLQQTLTDLQKEEYLGADISELERIDVTAWDMGRMVNVARYSYDLEYISESQAWEYIFFAERESASRYADWAAFSRAYIIGRALWGGKNLNLYDAMRTVNKLKKDKKSPWALVSLH